MPNQPCWMQGEFDPIQIEIDLLHSKLREARRSGDQIQENLILGNLHGLAQYKATG